MTLTDNDFAVLANVLADYRLSANDFTLTDAPSATALRPPVADQSWSPDLVDGAPVTSPQTTNGSTPLCIIKYNRATSSVPAGQYLVVVGDSDRLVRLVPAQGAPISPSTITVAPLVNQRASK